MFDKKALADHQEVIKAQSKRKDTIGKTGYNRRKLFEEIGELSVECEYSTERLGLSENFINELGGVLTCILGDPKLAIQLQERLEFNSHRIEVYKDVDRLIELEPEMGPLFNRLKYTPRGWFKKPSVNE